MFIFLFLIWVILNGRISLEIVLTGIVLSTIVFAFLCRFMNYSLKKDLHYLGLFPCIIIYIFVLLKEMLLSNLYVARLSLSLILKPEPEVITFSSGLKTPLARTVLANSITLTPGTVTVSVNEDVFTVHCLDKELAQGIEDSIFIRMLSKMEGAS